MPVGTNSSSFTTPVMISTTSFWVKVTNAANPSGASSNTATITVNQPLPTFETWTSGHNLTGENALPSATPAGDGVNNLLKYALGLNPTQTSVAVTDGTNPGLPSSKMSGGFMTFTFVKDTGRSDLTYRVESCGDIASWQALTTGIVETPLTGTQVRVVVTIPVNGRRFCRLNVTK